MSIQNIIKNKKAQISYFLIIGITLVIIIFFLIYINNVIIKRPTKDVAESQELAIKPIKTYITSCLIEVTNNALDLAGKQGGKIYTHQSGPTPEYVYGNILSDVSGEEGIFFMRKEEAAVEYDVPYLIKYTPLLSTYGINDLRIKHGVLKEQTIEYQLETYITNKIDECNLNTFQDSFEIIPEGAKDVDVSITEEDVVVKLKFPLKIKDKKTGAITELNEFIVNPKIRLENVYSFARDYISYVVFETDAPTDYDMDIVIDNNVKTSSIPHLSTCDDIVKIIDTKSNLGGKHFEFWFVKQDTLPC